MAQMTQFNPDEALAEIRQRVEGTKSSTPRLFRYTDELKKLQDQALRGDISQRDYTALYSKIAPELDRERAQLGQIGSDFNNFWGKRFTEHKELQKYGNVLSSAQELLGRDLTANEVAQILPRFGTGRPQDVEQGRAFVAELAAQEARSPKALQSKAGQYSGDVNTIFQDLVKRGATQEEINHFGSLMASGDVDAYTLRQFVGQLPEVQERQDAANRESLGKELSGYDQDFFNKAKENVYSDYARRGIPMGSSPAVDMALTNLMGDIQKQRSAYMAGLAREDYGARRGTTREDYLSSMNRYLGERDYGRQRSDAYQDLLTNRAYGSIDYQRQQQDLMNLLNSQPKQKSGGLGGMLAGGLAGAGALSSFGPWGAAAGGLLGAASYLDR